MWFTGYINPFSRSRGATPVAVVEAVIAVLLKKANKADLFLYI